ncbi:MAG: tetratricopeptide repeat protein [Myxococcaceae bacterium]
MRWPLVIAAVLLTGCATLRTRSDGRRSDALLTQLDAQGIHLDPPLTISNEMKERVEREVRFEGTELARMQRLHSFLRTQLGFKYDPNLTVGAEEAWAGRRGDCLSYAHLFNALARFIQVPVNYVRYRGTTTYEERSGALVVVSHVASLYNDYKVTVLVELTGTAPSWRVSDYEHLGDDEAVALHFSNLAMEHLQKGDVTWAKKVLEVLLVRTPDLPELQVNYAAVLLRQGHQDEALALLQKALDRFPDFHPLYVAAAIAADSAGRDDLAEKYAELARNAHVDPFVPFMRGVWLMEKHQYRAAGQLFTHATDLKPQSALFAAWLARAQLLQGDESEAIRTFEKAQQLDPRHPVLEDFKKLHPEFRHSQL